MRRGSRCARTSGARFCRRWASWWAWPRCSAASRSPTATASGPTRCGCGAAVAVLGGEAVGVFFPTGEAVGRQIRIGDVVATVVGTLAEKVFRFREGQGNMFAWRNEIVAVPATLVSNRMQGDLYRRVDRI